VASVGLDENGNLPSGVTDAGFDSIAECVERQGMETGYTSVTLTNIDCSSKRLLIGRTTEDVTIAFNSNSMKLRGNGETVYLLIRNTGDNSVTITYTDGLAVTHTYTVASKQYVCLHMVKAGGSTSSAGYFAIVG